ncbi:hypothetical protein [Microbacterium phyllosphaerae]|uniref:hypothetical protein n=1 Tax=Microbacterium phyllosphaerae TaxID=124798 RepID=UPI0021675C8B|nr:hypothetical protein [Microbacterium phyllosphaerae]MCS3441853.1 hypothetical protein [Microbacterium phyllosphaerae]
MTLPPIREWWSKISREARVEVLSDTALHLGDKAREEIRTITGAVVGMAETLSDDDLAFARAEAQAEVDAADAD